MNIRMTLITGALAGLSSTALAADATKPALNPTILGLADAIMAHCIKIDDRQEERYEQFRRSLTQGFSEQAIRAAHQDPAFHTNFELARNILAVMPRTDALQVCRDAVKP